MTGDAAVLGFSLLTLILAAGAGIVMALGNRSVLFLKDLPLPTGPLPSLSVVVAARNEEADVERSLATLLAQEYPGLEILAVDDRSEDSTGDILDRMAVGDSRLTVIHLRELPAGWLGKNHALQRGAEAAHGEFVLFTDADVRYDTGTLRRAAGFARDLDLDFLSVSPHIEADGILLKAFMGIFTALFTLRFLPWRARIPGSSFFVGLGAFNLVRREFYLQAGGHEPIRLRPDDDLMLAKRMKMRGARQDILFGCGALSVRWYPGVGELIRGLEKNTFAVYEYSYIYVLTSLPAVLALNLVPFAGPLLPVGPARWIFLAAALCIVLACFDQARFHGVAPWCGLLYPVILTLFSLIVLRATLLVALRGGIIWRGTFYPLDELRKNKVA